MLKWLRPKLPPRTLRSDLRVLHLDNGRSKVSFNEQELPDVTVGRTNRSGVTRDIPTKSPASDLAKLNSQFLVYNSLPPASSAPEKADEPNSSLCPPWHIHLKEDETFHVISGTAKFLVLDFTKHKLDGPSHNGTTIRLVPSGSSMTIPRGQIHTFRNANSKQRLELKFGFSPTSSSSQLVLNSKMHNFFLNTQLYRSDCTLHSVPRSMLQILLFNHSADVVLVPQVWLRLHRHLPLFRDVLEQWLAPSLGRMMNFLGGVVLGKWLCGLRSTYEEYTVEVDETQVISSQLDQIRQSLQDIEVALESVASVESTGKLGYDSRNTNPLVCQAWKYHNFDGQNEDWRK